MAKKKDRDEITNEKEQGESKAGTALIIVLIIFVWLAIFALLVKLDFAGIGSNVLRPLIKDVPVLNMILPEASDEQLIYEEDYPYSNIKEAVEVIKEQERQLDALTQQIEENRATISEQAAEIERMKVFEDEQLAFEERVREFDINVVYNSQAPDIDEYRKYYEEINPDTAEDIYRQIQEQLAYDAAIEEKATLLRNMKPAVAAEALQEMTADLRYTCKILLCMKPDEATAIMNKMDALFVAQLLQTMHDMDDEWADRIENNLLENNTE